MDPYRKIISKFTKKFGSKVINTTFRWTSLERSLRSLLRSLVVKSLIDNIFVEGLGFSELEFDHLRLQKSDFWTFQID